MLQPSYRPDIDGLRAVAVLSVVLHHLNSAWLPGGYTGVDIFFVISGFLITTHILTALREGEFSLWRFYQRRINRILPALLAVLLCSLFVGVLVLSPVDFERLATSALSTAVGLSNIFFWREYGNYFLPDAGEAVLLHTWSLGVEEQFYLLWPFFLILLFRATPRRIPLILVIATVIAVALSEYATKFFVSASYYLLPTRIFELMIGGGLAAYLIDRPAPRLKWFAPFCKFSGVVLLAASFVTLNRSSPFPGVNGLLPCLGAALLIFSGSAGQPLMILTSRAFVAVGLISYSMYLWHWPIIAYLNYLDIEINLSIAFSVIAVTIFMAFLSWRFIETPFRSSGALQKVGPVFLTRLLLPVLVLSGLWYLTKINGGFPQRFDPRVAELERMASVRPNELRKNCHVPNALYRMPLGETCVLGGGDAEVDGILIGDSYANHFSGMVDELAKAEGLRITDYTMDGCPPILGYGGGNQPSYAERCKSRNENAYETILRKKYRLVILAANWPADEASLLLDHSLKTLLASGASVVVVHSNQTIPKGASCPIRKLIYGGEGTECAVDETERASYWQHLQASYPSVRFIDPNRIICPGRRCSPIVDSTLLYRDSGHLNDVGARLIGRKLLEMGESLLIARSIPND